MDAKNEIRLLLDGKEAFPAWLEAIGAAKSEILLEMYWFESDKTGRTFAEALSKRARDGLDVFLLYDSVGSIGAERSMFEDMESAGVRVIEYNPIAPWRRRFRLDRVGTRDHRKILVVDTEVGFVGGINICDQQASRESGGGGWRDDAVEIRGPSVNELRALFFDTWIKSGGPSARKLEALAMRTREALVAAAREQLGAPAPRRLLGIGAPTPERSITVASSADLAAPPVVQVIGHAASAARRTLRRVYLQQIRHARRKILIANSYFIPDITIRRGLERASARGVEVRVILPRDSDVPSVGYASRALYARLMRAGIQIHEWVDGMLHAKCALIDEWATVGSYNLDYRSLLYNLEANVASVEPAFVESVERSFRADIQRCVQVDPVAWSKRSRWSRVLEWMHYYVRKLL